ncbi:dual specificity protein phosphatase family protein [Pseudooceanicola sp. CBS1P-1]|uniref:Tyrosine specific protein phosphatases domain-containing protein n=1 Tax=Pseudooceanicola albus TaxID=2692189 RepID=A0A6L7G865_9RHOB|nr:MULTISPECIES: dual specificity protein phosphatase family protein [Pseudooceanicola]MBT9384123.1 dual specificity protein phosphatase family protein [Pseudooceanicola endophyticus]MXN19777.1 hypothetical protein [Pseudooceanicola albus]
MSDTNASSASLFRALVPMPGAGQVAMSGFPGLQSGIDGQAYIDPLCLEDTLADIRATGAPLLILLVESEELPEAALPLLRAALAPRGIALHHLPIADFQAPGPAFMACWRALSPQLHALLDRGGSFALSCQYGAGRSGLVCAMLMMERGLDAPRAIAEVRARFHEAVESEAQVQWLEAYAPAPRR